ncbi:MAG TPA: hypothetical protein VG756_23810 [Pseudonocardiaceae bacterium]|jgi:hypothetical protein|nr:hypothetical protein [Pseudonocardiaceae bacterium]
MITRWRNAGNRGASSASVAAWSWPFQTLVVITTRASTRASIRASSRPRMVVMIGASTAPRRQQASAIAAACHQFGSCVATTSPGPIPSSARAPANRSTWSASSPQVSTVSPVAARWASNAGSSGVVADQWARSSTADSRRQAPVAR